MANQLRRVYPTRPERADAWLGREIMRAARDPGALGVFRHAGRRAGGWARPWGGWVDMAAVAAGPSAGAGRVHPPMRSHPHSSIRNTTHKPFLSCRSVFYLPKPRALNYLVASRFGKPTLVLQGALDPLNNAPQRADDIDRLCPNAQVKPGSGSWGGAGRAGQEPGIS